MQSSGQPRKTTGNFIYIKKIEIIHSFRRYVGYNLAADNFHLQLTH